MTDNLEKHSSFNELKEQVQELSNQVVELKKQVQTLKDMIQDEDNIPPENLDELLPPDA